MAPITDDIALDRIARFLRPPGCGCYSESLGLNPWAKPLLRQLYGSDDSAEAVSRWRSNLTRLGEARAILVGVPSDTGGGARRGAAFGPIGVREALYRDSLPSDVCDIGDVICIPHLLHDSMLAEPQIERSRAALYGKDGGTLPVSPLSIAEALRAQIAITLPSARLISIGGDHSISYAMIKGTVSNKTKKVGVIHIDAHSDLSRERFGVSITYSSWLYALLRSNIVAAVVQLGLQEHTSEGERLPVVQIGADAISSSGAGTAIEAARVFMNRMRIDEVYLTIDVDVTRESEAPATGIPATRGLPAAQVRDLIGEISGGLRIIGGDVVEVAPTLSGIRDWSMEPTCQTAASYVRTLFEALGD